MLFGLGGARSPSSSASAWAPTRAGDAAARSDHVGNGARLVLYSMPYFVHRHAPAHHLRRGPGLVPDVRHAHARRRPTDSVDQLARLPRHLVLPLATVALGLIGAVLDPHALVDHRDPLARTTSRPPGPRASRSRVLRQHAVPNALLPTVTLIAHQPRLRRRRRDHRRGRLQLAGPRHADGRGARRPRLPGPAGHLPAPVVSVVVANLAADLVYGFLDPRVRT